jgi:hypothetical protein
MRYILKNNTIILQKSSYYTYSDTCYRQKGYYKGLKEELENIQSSHILLLHK